MIVWTFLWMMLSSAYAEENAEQQAQAHLRNAQTWYYLARLTENDKSAHQLSAEAYQAALNILKDQKTAQAKAMNAQAKLGLEQTIPRIDNAHDTFRNVMWPIWWITEADPTAEWYDDLYMKATEICWTNIEAQMLQFKNPSRIPVITRGFRNSALQAPSAIDEMTIPDRLQLLRDELLSYADMTQNLYGVSDDMGSRILGNSWTSLIQEKKINPQHIIALGDQLDTKFVMLIDVKIEDEIPKKKDHTDVVRLQTQAYILNTQTGTVVNHILVQGLGQNVRSENWSAIRWILGSFIIAMILVIIRAHRLQEESDGKQKVGFLLVGLGAFIAGSILAEFAGDLSSEFLQDWGTPTYVREWSSMTLPYFPALIWPLVHGAVVMVGPLFILAWISVKLREQIDTLIEDPSAHMSVIAPTAQAGAATVMFYPLIEGVPETGFWVAFCISFPAILLSFFMAVPLAEVLQGRLINRKKICALAMGILTLLLLLPFGLYNNNHFFMCIFACVIGGIMLVLLREEAFKSKSIEVEDPTADDQTINIGKDIGSLEHPAWLNPNSGIDLIACIKEKKPIHIRGISKYGATRTIEEIQYRLQSNNMRFIHISLTEPSNVVQEPYETIKQICQKIGLDHLDLAKNEHINQTMQEGILQAESLVSMFPGFGLIVDTLSETGGDVHLSRSRIIEDGAQSIIQTLKKNPIEAIFIENLHWIDPSSLEVLSRYMELAENMPSLIWNTTQETHQEIEDFHKIVSIHHPKIEFTLPKLTVDQAKQFLQKSGVYNFPDTLLEDLLGTSDGSIGGLQLLLMLMKEHDLLLEKTLYGKRIYVPIEGISEKDVWEKLPKETKEQELKRLESLNRETMFVLECAALCGTTCTIDELEFGTTLSRQDVLLRLETIENITPPVIEDVPDQDGEFRFVNNLTRLALIERLTTSKRDVLRELAKSVHASIIRQHKTQPFLTEREIIHHAVPLTKTNDLILSAASILFSDLEQKYAWPETIQFYERIRPRLNGQNPLLSLKIDIIAAKAYRFIGGQRNRDRTQEILLQHIHEPKLAISELSEDILCDIFFTLCETIFEENNKDDLLKLEEICAQQQELSYPPLIQEIFAFYACYANSNRNGNTPILTALKEILTRLEGFPEPHSRSYKILYSSVYQTYAKKSWYEQLPSRDDPDGKQKMDALWNTEVLNNFETVLKLKQEIHDHHGIAINYGLRGSIYLFTFRNGEKAVEAYTKDWEVVNENNMRADKSRTINALGLSYALRSTQTEDSEQRKNDFMRAKECVFEAIQYAEDMERETDFAFALSAILDLAVQEKQALGEVTTEIMEVLSTLDIPYPSSKTEAHPEGKERFILRPQTWESAFFGAKSRIPTFLSQLPDFTWKTFVLEYTTPKNTD